ncbi:hypothetical protein AURDEDRAFT_167260 [Auricularia subglabra TFB-10046 SS5]|nr:hypothetical protein AURDEDRAFT_167260 [Auricularia subglabra TFB-10046 SS5]
MDAIANNAIETTGPDVNCDTPGGPTYTCVIARTQTSQPEVNCDTPGGPTYTCIIAPYAMSFDLRVYVLSGSL